MAEATGTSWEGGEAKAYEVAKHGPDGAKFLDTYVYRALTPTKLAGQKVIDIGGGTGPWAEYALRMGAKVAVTFDLNPAMVEEGKATRFGEIKDLPYAHSVAGTQGKARVLVGDAAHIPFRIESGKDGYFTTALSINVGCNLPGVIETKRGTEHIFDAHFKEAFRVTEPGGQFLVTAPNSLATVFTDGTPADSLQEEIDAKWAASEQKNKEGAKAILRGYSHVLRATFVLDESGKPVVITKDTAHLVKSGMPIIRKIPGLVVDNIYHTAEEYKGAALAAGWEIEEAVEDSFENEEVRVAYNASHSGKESLGSEYVGQAPFLVLKLRKPTKSSGN